MNNLGLINESESPEFHEIEEFAMEYGCMCAEDIGEMIKAMFENHVCPICDRIPEEDYPFRKMRGSKLSQYSDLGDKMVLKFECNHDFMLDDIKFMWELRGQFRKNVKYEEHQAESLIKAYIPAEFQEATIANYPGKDRYQNTHRAAKLFVENFDGKRKEGILLLGKSGVGKTTLLASIANDLIRKGFSVNFMKVASFIRDLNLAIGDRNANRKKMIQDALNSDLLVMVDLGKEPETEATARTIYTLLDERHDNHKPIIADSNYLGVEQLEMGFTGRVNESGYDQAITSRIVGMCRGNIFVLKSDTDFRYEIEADTVHKLHSD